jgi:hypothetical protein
MSMIDVLTRVDAICKKYDRYDADKHRNDAADPFSRLYADIDAVIDEAMEVSRLPLNLLSHSCTSPSILCLKCRTYGSWIQKSERAARETNRATKVTLNAGVRRIKARLMEDVVKLQKLSVKKVTIQSRTIQFRSSS